MAKYDIMDVSEHQNSIDWSKAKDDINGVIIRIGYGDDDTSQDDKYAVRNMDECERLGIPYGVYLYSYANSTAHIASEIAHMQRMIKGRNVTGGIWLDLEVRNYRAYWREATIAWMKAFPEQGGVYSWQWAFTDVLQGVECRKWICAYGTNNGYPQSDYKPTIDCDGWQYTSRATVAGVSGNVDMSEWYADFGTATATQATTSPAVTRGDIVAQMCAWEGWNEVNGKYKAIIDIYNDYLPTAVKAGCANYEVKFSDEWCATAASACYIACGAGYMFPVECSCPRMVTLAKSMGIWVENDGYIPQPGDAVLYDWDDSGSGDNVGTPDHIGIVISVSGSTFVVMEGNKNEAVARRTMSINGRYIRGFVCPKFSESVTKTVTKSEETKTVVKTYEISKTGTPSKVVIKWGLLKAGQKVTARRKPIVTGEPCSFSPVQPLTRINVCDYITDNQGKRWAYCQINGLYGYILSTSIRDYLRTSGMLLETVAKQVIAGDFGNNEDRVKALTTLGYDPDIVQAKVNDLLGYVPSADTKYRVWPIWFFEGDESLFGDCTAILEYDASGSVAHCILIDAAQGDASATVIKKLQKAGVTKIDAFVLSHGHGDHYGGLTNIKKAIPIEHIYVPDVTELAKYQSSYASAIKHQASKATSTYLKAGSTFTVGGIKCQCLYICPADNLSEHDYHHFVNNESAVLRFTLGDWTFHSAGDLQNEGNNLLIKTGINLRADIMKCQWHGDANATNEAIAKAVCPKVAFSNYHHTEQSGRGTTRKRLEAVGAVVARNAENGDIYIDCQGNKMTLSCSKGNLSKTWTK